MHIFTDLEFSDDFEIREQAFRDLARRLKESPLDAREALDQFSPQVDEFQALVVNASERTIRVVAPAGSGKTQTVVNRTLHQVKEGLQPTRILMLTFDRAAVSSIVQKLEVQLESLQTQIDPPTIKTLNGFGFQLLREFVPDEFKEVAEPYRRRRAFNEVRKGLKEKSPERHSALPPNLSNRFFLELFSLLKNELFDPRNLSHQELSEFLIGSAQTEALFVDPEDKGNVRLVLQSLMWMYEAFEQVLQRENLIDFDDQKLRAYVELKDDPSLQEAIQRKYDEVIVDEFQDINKLDFVFIKMIAKKATLVVTGDDDQAIYGFRGCTPEYIINLDKHIGNGRTVAKYELSKNYRCPPNIVKAADRLIQYNSWRIPKKPVAVNTLPAEINVVSSLSSSLEANLVVDFLSRVRRSNSTLPYSEFAVLYRANAQSLPLQVEFILKSIPYHVREEHHILKNEMLDRLMGVLRLKLAINRGQRPAPHDCVLTVRSYFQWVPNDAIAHLHALFEADPNFAEAIGSNSFYSILPKAEKSHFPVAVQEVIRAKTLMDTLDVLAKRYKGLRGIIGSLEDVVENRASLGEVYELAANFRGKLDHFVENLEAALAKAKDENVGFDEEGGVRLSTYFGAKGLQWHTVMLVGCNEGLIPHSKAPIEEERRLFYVAMTRAVSNLLISYVQNVAKNDVNPSRFIGEAGLL